jgi:hypothetical protein
MPNGSERFAVAPPVAFTAKSYYLHWTSRPSYTPQQIFERGFDYRGSGKIVQAMPKMA